MKKMLCVGHRPLWQDSSETQPAKCVSGLVVPYLHNPQRASGGLFPEDTAAGEVLSADGNSYRQE